MGFQKSQWQIEMLSYHTLKIVQHGYSVTEKKTSLSSSINQAWIQSNKADGLYYGIRVTYLHLIEALIDTDSTYSQIWS